MANNTVSSSQTNVGAGMQQHSYYTDALGTQKNPPPATTSNPPLMPDLTDEKKLFFATVYGEAAAQGVVAWAAVASTIMNRVNNHNFKFGPIDNKILPTNATEVIEHGGYDAYKSNTPLYREAKAMLDNPTSANRDDLAILIKLIQIVYPIYLGYARRFTDADLYFSPKTEWEKYHLKWPKDWNAELLDEVFIPGINSEDFRFFKYKGER